MKLDEDNVKKYMINYLKNEGFEIDEHKTSNIHGPDIVTKPNKKIDGMYVLECKGYPSGKNVSQQLNNYFIYALGQIILDMDSNENKYGIVFPDVKPLRKKINRIPIRMLKLLDLDFFFVKENGEIKKITSKDMIKNFIEILKIVK